MEPISTKCRPYLCKLCGKRVHTVSALQQHTRIHRTIFPYQCSLCSKSFRLLSQLKGHQVQHDQEKPLMCGWCDEHFLEQYQLGQHLLRRHKIMASSMGTKVIITSPARTTPNSVPSGDQMIVKKQTVVENGECSYNEKTKSVVGLNSKVDEAMDTDPVVTRKPMCWEEDEGSQTLGIQNGVVVNNNQQSTFELNQVKASKVNHKRCRSPSSSDYLKSESEKSCKKEENLKKRVKRKLPLEDTTTVDALVNGDIAKDEMGQVSVMDVGAGDSQETTVIEFNNHEESNRQTEEAETNEAIMLLTELEDTADTESADEKDGQTSIDMKVEEIAGSETQEKALIASVETQENTNVASDETVEKTDTASLLETGIVNSETLDEETSVLESEDTLEESQIPISETLEESGLHLAMMTDDYSQSLASQSTTVRDVLRGDPSLHVCPSREDLLMFDENLPFEETYLEKSKPTSELAGMVPTWSNSCANLSGLITGTPHKLSVDPGAASVNASPAMSPFRATIGQGDSDSDDSDTESEGVLGADISKTATDTASSTGPVTVDKESSISPGHTEVGYDLPIQPNTIAFVKSEDTSTFVGLKSLTEHPTPTTSSDGQGDDCKGVTSVPNGLPSEWKLVNGKFCKVPIETDDTTLCVTDTLKESMSNSHLETPSDSIPPRKKRKCKSTISDDFVTDGQDKGKGVYHVADQAYSKAFEDFIYGHENNKSQPKERKKPGPKPRSKNYKRQAEKKQSGRPVANKCEQLTVEKVNNTKLNHSNKTRSPRPKREKRKAKKDLDYVYSEDDITAHNVSDSEVDSRDTDSASVYSLRPNRRKNFQFLEEEGNFGCKCCTSSHQHIAKHKTVNIQHFQLHVGKVHELRVLITKLIQTVFPDITYPNLFHEGGLAVEYLMDEIMGACSEGQQKKTSFAPFGKLDDEVKVVLCKYPQGCLRHLRRKALRLLNSLLPDIESEGLEPSEINSLIEKVIETNQTDADF